MADPAARPLRFGRPERRELGRARSPDLLHRQPLENPPGFVAPSTGWDWRKFDYGVRIGIVRGLDLTAEYARHDATTRRGFVHPDEWLVTLRAAF